MYDYAYLQEYEKRAATDLGKEIYKERWRYVQEFVQKGTLLDYGCATGAFHRSAPKSFDAYGFDINPFAGFDHPHPYNGVLDILTMWDSIEHLIDPTRPIVKHRPKWLFISTPNIDTAGPTVDDVFNWKHFKPGEHIHYFNLKSLTAVLGCVGYKVVGYSFEEGALRDPKNPKAILSVAAKR